MKIAILRLPKDEGEEYHYELLVPLGDRIEQIADKRANFASMISRYGVETVGSNSLPRQTRFIIANIKKFIRICSANDLEVEYFERYPQARGKKSGE